MVWSLFVTYQGEFARNGIRVDAALRGQGDDIAPVATMWFKRAIGPRHSLQINASYLEILPQRDPRIWFWDENGYSFLEDNGVAVTRDTLLQKSRRTTVDVSWQTDFGRHLYVKAGVYYRHFSRQQFERQDFQYDPSDVSFSAPVQLVSQQGGDIGGTGIILHGEPGAGVSWHASYRYQKAIDGDAAFNAVWGTTPRDVVRATLTYRPVDRFSIWVMGRYWSSTEWPDYRDVDAQSNGRYPSTLGSMFRLDVALQKRMWAQHMRASLIFRNVLNNAIRYHPAGAIFKLAVLVQVEFAFGGSAR